MPSGAKEAAPSGAWNAELARDLSAVIDGLKPGVRAAGGAYMHLPNAAWGYYAPSAAEKETAKAHWADTVRHLNAAAAKFDVDENEDWLIYGTDKYDEVTEEINPLPVAVSTDLQCVPYWRTVAQQTVDNRVDTRPTPRFGRPTQPGYPAPDGGAAALEYLYTWAGITGQWRGALDSVGPTVNEIWRVCSDEEWSLFEWWYLAFFNIEHVVNSLVEDKSSQAYRDIHVFTSAKRNKATKDAIEFLRSNPDYAHLKPADLVAKQGKRLPRNFPRTPSVVALELPAEVRQRAILTPLELQQQEFEELQTSGRVAYALPKQPDGPVINYRVKAEWYLDHQEYVRQGSNLDRLRWYVYQCGPRLTVRQDCSEVKTRLAQEFRAYSKLAAAQEAANMATQKPGNSFFIWGSPEWRSVLWPADWPPQPSPTPWCVPPGHTADSFADGFHKFVAHPFIPYQPGYPVTNVRESWLTTFSNTQIDILFDMKSRLDTLFFSVQCDEDWAWASDYATALGNTAQRAHRLWVAAGKSGDLSDYVRPAIAELEREIPLEYIRSASMGASLRGVPITIDSE